MKHRRRRNLAVCGRLNFEPAVGGLHAKARIIMADVGHGIDEPATKHPRLTVLALSEAEVAFDNGIRDIYAIHDNRYAGPTGNHEVKTFTGESREARSGQNGQGHRKAHSRSFAVRERHNLSEAWIPRVKIKPEVQVRLTP